MKESLVVAAALLLLVLLRQQSAAMRHWVLAVAIACALAVPALELILPSWQMMRPARLTRFTLTDRAVPAPRSVSTEETFSISGGRNAASPAPKAAVGNLVAIAWVAGAAVSFTILLTGLGRLAWLASRARLVTDRKWAAVLGPVRLLQSDHPTLLVTWGLVRPKIILPAPARAWSDDRMRIVLWHELAHIRRGDWLAQMIAEVLRSVYWFNPLLWLACRRLRQESEQACDDAVLNRGVEGPDYATALVELARDLKQRRTWLPAPAMARPSSLERRVKAMLNTHVNRRSVNVRSRVAAVLALAVITIPIAAAQTFATLSGSVMDAQGLPLPKASLVLSNAERSSKYEVRSNAAGAFEFVGLPAGSYAFDVKVAGFATVHETIPIAAGQSVQRALTLKVGSLEETITVDDAVEPRRRAAVQRIPFTPEDLTKCAGAPPVGGNIKAPRKIWDVAPVYPANLRGSGTEGDVVMDATIGLDGYVNKIDLHDGANPDLADAAVTAVREWQYSQTLLNCVPIEVSMTVTTHFRQAR